jgi:lysozyme
MALKVKDGIDVSYAQPDVNWDEIAKDAGFAFIKATEGQTFIDPSLSSERVKAATKALTWRVGYYHFARPDNNPAALEATHFVKSVRAVGGKLGRNGVLDYETYHPDSKDEEWIKAFITQYKKLTDERPIIYGGNILRERTHQAFGCPLWLAAYVTDPAPYVPAAWKKRGWRIWQYTDHGKCKGVPGNVDRNRFNGDSDALHRVLA